MPVKSSNRCSICSGHRWAIENAYLAHGRQAALEVCTELEISRAAFDRHLKHMRLQVETPPVEPDAIEWTRAAINLAAAVEQYHIIEVPERVSNIAILVGTDDQGKYIELVIIHSEGAVDHQRAGAMAFDMGLDLSDEEVASGLTPTRRMSAKLHADEIFIGKRSNKR